MTALPDRIITDSNPSLGLVIGSYAAVPYVHLQLETHRRYYADVPVLVVDDGSPCRAALTRLCTQYGVDLHVNDERLVEPGDLRVYSAGLRWARTRKLDLLMKFSRRFVPVIDWATPFKRLAVESQAATYSSICRRCGMGFRTECIGFHVDSWLNAGLDVVLEGEITKRAKHFVEGYMHSLAQTLIGKVCQQHSAWVARHPGPHDQQGYARPEWMGTNRFELNPVVIWHDIDAPLVYYRQARALGITDYKPDDFNEPNSSAGCA